MHRRWPWILRPCSCPSPPQNHLCLIWKSEMTIEMVQCPFECHTLLPDDLPLAGNAWLEGKLIFLNIMHVRLTPPVLLVDGLLHSLRLLSMWGVHVLARLLRLSWQVRPLSCTYTLQSKFGSFSAASGKVTMTWCESRLSPDYLRLWVGFSWGRKFCHRSTQSDFRYGLQAGVFPIAIIGVVLPASQKSKP